MRNAIAILNPHAGSLRGSEPEHVAGEIRAAFAGVGVTIAMTKLDAGGRLKSLCAEIAAQRPDAVFVGGGDGTISTAAGCLAGTGIPLGVLPLGTLNHFARDLGIPADWREAVPVFGMKHFANVDLGEVNGRLFLNNCSLGAYPEAVRRRDALRRERGTRKWAAMFIASIAVFRRLKSLRFQVRTGDVARSIRAPFLVVANNRYSGYVLDGSLRARLDQHQLWIYTTRVQRRWALLRLAWQSLLRRIDSADDLESWAAAELSIQVERHRGRLPIGIDGEVTDLVPPLRFRVVPDALRVFVGQREAAP